MKNSKRLAFAFCLAVAVPITVPAQAGPLAAGQPKFLGCAYSAAQAANFTTYFNQLTPENAGKWGSVETSRDVMNWADLDTAYNLAKSNGLPFKMHNLIWGNQQPAWIETLPADQQLLEIKQWFAAVAARYPDIDLIDVVNEPLHAPPNHAGNGGGNYIDALGGTGTTGWDWVLAAFRLARTYFPNAKLLVNEYSVTNSASSAQQYLQIVQLLKAEKLIDGVGIQAHAFETTVPNATTLANLDLIATAGLPIYISELDVDGATEQIQLDGYQRIFPVFWEHPAVVGVTLWGFRPGLWRDAFGAALVRADGSEKPAMVWLRSYLASDKTESTARLVNISTRALGGTGNDVAIGGFVLSGSGTKQVLIRAVGPTLTSAGLGQSEVMLDPMIEVHDARNGNLVIANNDDWGSNANAAEITSTAVQIGASALSAGDAKSSALLLSMQPGVYTFVVNGRNQSSGVVLAEVYDADTSNTSTTLVNISSRARCSTGNGVAIGGFVVSGNGFKHLLVRAVGPTLTSLGIGANEVLLDPVVEVHDARNGNVVIATNDNWVDNANSPEIGTTATRVGATPLATSDTKSAALLLTLQPGVYSFVASGKGGTSGIVLVEVYDAD